jgi:uncharacterized protein YhaN
MIIEKISIKSFGMITDMTLEFSDTINVIEGQNEAGKSTIAAFIKYMLYGFSNVQDPDKITERNRFINWETGAAMGTMTVSVKGKRYLISRSTVRVDGEQRDTYKEESTITDLETGVPAFGKVPAGEVFFGVEMDLFENTAFIGQIGDLRINEDSVSESIENILFSGSEKINNQRAASKVALKMETLLHRSGSGGVIYDLVRRGEDYDARFKRADEDNKQILAKEAKLHEIKQARAAEVERMEKLCDLDVCYRNVVIIQNFDRLHALEKELEEKNNEYNTFVEENMRAGYVPTGAYLTDIAVARRGVDDSYRALVEADRTHTEQKHAVGITKETEAAIELADELSGETNILSEIDKAKHNRFLDIIAMAGGALALIASIIVEIAAGSGVGATILRILFGVVGTASLGLIGTMLYFFMKNKAVVDGYAKKFSVLTEKELLDKLDVIKEARAKRDGMIRSTENARLAVEAAKERYALAKKELLDVIVRWGGEPPHSNLGEYLDKLEESVREYLARERQIMDERLEIETKVRELRTFLAGKSEIDTRAQVPPFKRKVLNDIDHESILEGIEDCKNSIKEYESLALMVEDELSGLKMRAIDPGEVYSKIQENDEKVAGLKELHKAHYVALRAIEEASDNLREEISPRLGEFSTALMEIMTDKKYDSFDVSEGLRVTFKDKNGEDKSVDFLSGGTRDLAYVAVRMALIDMLYPEKPPISFDESFAHQDNQRARSMMKAIECLASSGHQSFIFTCRAREGAIAKELCQSAEIFRLSTNVE